MTTDTPDTTIKKSQFTPGPWEVLQGDRCYHVASKDRTFETACIMFAGGEGSGAANARLIAAAPALYNALRDSALALHKVGAYHNPASTTFEQCQRSVCVNARTALALVDPPTTEEEKK